MQVIPTQEHGLFVVSQPLLSIHAGPLVLSYNVTNASHSEDGSCVTLAQSNPPLVADDGVLKAVASSVAFSSVVAAVATAVVAPDVAVAWYDESVPVAQDVNRQSVNKTASQSAAKGKVNRW